MADGTLIEWARHPHTGLGATWNIVTGCSVVSPGCTNCYAMRLAGGRLQHHPSRQGLTVPSKAGPVWNGQTRFNRQWLTLPLTWEKPYGIFVAAHGDLFAEGVTDEHLDAVFRVMAETPRHIYYVLTKRPQRMRDYLVALGNERQRLVEMVRQGKLPPPHQIWKTTRWPFPNVWLGVSVEDQARADERIPLLLETPSARRFISAEPLLGPIDLIRIDAGHLGRYDVITRRAWTPYNRVHPSGNLIDWVIVGGESGPHARPMHPDWARSLRDQCAAARAPFFFKQWGDLVLQGSRFVRIGKKAAGRLLDGIEHNAFPEVRS